MPTSDSAVTFNITRHGGDGTSGAGPTGGDDGRGGGIFSSGPVSVTRSSGTDNTTGLGGSGWAAGAGFDGGNGGNGSFGSGLFAAGPSLTDSRRSTGRPRVSTSRQSGEHGRG